MRAKIIKIVGWRLGMTVGVYLITDGKVQSNYPWQHALTDEVIGLVLGGIFAWKLGTNVAK
jgi:hypothetical protein